MSCLDDNAGSELESLFQPVPRITIDAVSREVTSAYSLALMPGFGDIMEQARGFGYLEVSLAAASSASAGGCRRFPKF